MQVSRQRYTAADLEQVAAANIAAGQPNVFGAMGFFWLPRELMGDEQLCIAYYEQPELVHDILETWCGLLEHVLEQVLDRVEDALPLADGREAGERQGAGGQASSVSAALLDRLHAAVDEFMAERRLPCISASRESRVVILLQSNESDEGSLHSLAEALLQALQSGDTVLIKGSRSAGMERLAADLLARGED